MIVLSRTTDDSVFAQTLEQHYYLLQTKAFITVNNDVLSRQCLTPVSIKHGLRTTDSDYGLGIKHGLGIKRGLSITDWV